jgi:hypothetical protein
MTKVWGIQDRASCYDLGFTRIENDKTYDWAALWLLKGERIFPKFWECDPGGKWAPHLDLCVGFLQCRIAIWVNSGTCLAAPRSRRSDLAVVQIWGPRYVLDSATAVGERVKKPSCSCSERLWELRLIAGVCDCPCAFVLKQRGVALVYNDC